MTTRILTIDRLGTEDEGARVTIKFDRNGATSSISLCGRISADSPTGFRQSLPRGVAFVGIECSGPISFSIQES